MQVNAKKRARALTNCEVITTFDGVHEEPLACLHVGHSAQQRTYAVALLPSQWLKWGKSEMSGHGGKVGRCVVLGGRGPPHDDRLNGVQPVLLNVRAHGDSSGTDAPLDVGELAELFVPLFDLVTA